MSGLSASILPVISGDADKDQVSIRKAIINIGQNMAQSTTSSSSAKDLVATYDFSTASPVVMQISADASKPVIILQGTCAANATFILLNPSTQGTLASYTIINKLVSGTNSYTLTIKTPSGAISASNPIPISRSGQGIDTIAIDALGNVYIDGGEPLSIATNGPGRVIFAQPGTGNGYTLPAGGSWVYYVLEVVGASGVVYGAYSGGGFAAGGTQIASPAAGYAPFVFAKELQ